MRGTPPPRTPTGRVRCSRGTPSTIRGGLYDPDDAVRRPSRARRAPQFGPVGDSAQIGHDVAVGTKGDKPRKPKHQLPKVPKHEEPNTLPLPGLVGGATTGPGPGGYGGDHQHSHAPGRAGKALLWLLGRRRKEPDPTA